MHKCDARIILYDDAFTQNILVYFMLSIVNN